MASCQGEAVAEVFGELVRQERGAGAEEEAFLGDEAEKVMGFLG